MELLSGLKQKYSWKCLGYDDIYRWEVLLDVIDVVQLFFFHKNWTDWYACWFNIKVNFLSFFFFVLFFNFYLSLRMLGDWSPRFSCSCQLSDQRAHLFDSRMSPAGQSLGRFAIRVFYISGFWRVFSCHTDALHKQHQIEQLCWGFAGSTQ